MVERFITEASSYAANIDFVIDLVGALVGFWFFVTVGVFFYLLFRFRHRDGVASEYITGDEKELKRLSASPTT